MKNVVGKYRTGSWYQREEKDIEKIVVHHSAWNIDRRLSHDTVLKTIQGWHQNKGWPGLSYHFAIMPDGTVYQCNDFSDITWHDTVNEDSVSVLVHGYFHPEVNDKPTTEQLKSLKDLLDWLCTENPQFPADHDDVIGHRYRYSTACPGDHLMPYVVEYRENKGSVSWINEEQDEKIKELEEKLEKQTSLAKKYKKERDEKDKKYEAAKKTAETMEKQKNDALVRLETALKNAETWQGKYQDSEKEIKRLEDEIERLSNDDWTIKETFIKLLNKIAQKIGGDRK